MDAAGRYRACGVVVDGDADSGGDAGEGVGSPLSNPLREIRRTSVLECRTGRTTPRASVEDPDLRCRARNGPAAEPFVRGRTANPLCRTSDRYSLRCGCRRT